MLVRKGTSSFSNFIYSLIDDVCSRKWQFITSLSVNGYKKLGAKIKKDLGNLQFSNTNISQTVTVLKRDQGQVFFYMVTKYLIYVIKTVISFKNIKQVVEQKNAFEIGSKCSFQNL